MRISQQEETIRRIEKLKDDGQSKPRRARSVFRYTGESIEEPKSQRRQSYFTKLNQALRDPTKDSQIKEILKPDKEESWVERWLQLDDFYNKNIYKGGMVEFVACFMYIHLGQMAVMTIIGEAKDGVVSILSIAISQALLLTFSLLCFANSSGGHLNPYVTFALWISGMETFPRLIVYMICQLLGFILGSYCTMIALGIEGRDDLTTGSIGGFSWGQATTGQAVMIEFTGSLVLILLSYGIAVDPNNSKIYGPILGPVSVGFGLAMCIYYTGGIVSGCTGAGMNPWKALGPAIVTGNFDRTWIYIIIPFVAAIVNGLIYKIAPPKFFEAQKAAASTNNTSASSNGSNSIELGDYNHLTDKLN